MSIARQTVELCDDHGNVLERQRWDSDQFQTVIDQVDADGGHMSETFRLVPVMLQVRDSLDRILRDHEPAFLGEAFRRPAEER